MRDPLRSLLASLLLGSVFIGASASAESDSCREWRGEHRRYQAEAVRLYLGGASQRSLDEAVFELLQREAYLTSCEQAASAARVDQVGWRLVGRPADEYASAVVESLLERAGFDVSLRSLLSGSRSVAAPRSPSPGWPGPRRGRAAR